MLTSTQLHQRLGRIRYVNSNSQLTGSEFLDLNLSIPNTTILIPLGCPTPQRITTYSLSPNRQRPLAGTMNAAIFNTFRRCRAQVLYVVPPFVAAYAVMNWAVERYVLLPCFVAVVEGCD